MEKKRKIKYKKNNCNGSNNLSQKELYGFTRRLYSILEDEIFKINLKKLRLYDGLYHRDSIEIDLDYRKTLLSTLVHEVIHHIHSSWSETKVAAYEIKIINSLTVRQIKNIIISLGKNI